MLFVRKFELIFNLRRADFGRARQINDLATFADSFQEVKLARPIVTDNKDIHVIFEHVSFFLLPILFGNDKVDVTNGFKNQLALIVGKIAAFVFFTQIEFISRQRHDKIVAEIFGAAQQIYMPVMQKVEGAVSYNSLQVSNLPKQIIF